MESIQIDIVNPKAKKLLQNLADLNLIKIKHVKKTDLTALLEKLRGKSNGLSLEEITKEVETVRATRYGK
ncbi:MAG TPA: hypothetical protein VFM82_00775 [Flavobacteriaceae bacterium]|nr:hypothetical protein [Flavobacteriaceae bacterium]